MSAVPRFSLRSTGMPACSSISAYISPMISSSVKFLELTTTFLPAALPPLLAAVVGVVPAIAGVSVPTALAVVGVVPAMAGVSVPAAAGAVVLVAAAAAAGVSVAAAAGAGAVVGVATAPQAVSNKLKVKKRPAISAQRLRFMGSFLLLLQSILQSCNHSW